MIKKKIIIIGGGLAGCFMALCLDSKKYDINIYEAGEDIRHYPEISGRSYNLTLYYRSILALKRINIWDEVAKHTILAEGNVAHFLNKKPQFTSFDTSGKEVLFTIHRNNLNSTFLNLIEKKENIKIYFNTKCQRIDFLNKTIVLEKISGHFSDSADIIIGADGVNSFVRTNIKNEKSDKSEARTYEDWGYKEVNISEQTATKLNLRNNSTHTWPRKNSLLLAFPNPDKTFTLMFNLPLKGINSFEELISEPFIKTYLDKNFPDLTDLSSQITESFIKKPTGSFVTVLTNNWYLKSFVLVGDSAHGVIPFYGQGTCAAFDDCLLLRDLIDNTSSLEDAFKKYQDTRKPNTDVLAALSRENFIELREKNKKPFSIAKDKIDTLLHKLFPNNWLPPLYYTIAKDTIDYKKAYDNKKKQDLFAKYIGVDLLAYLLMPFFSFSKK